MNKFSCTKNLQLGEAGVWETAASRVSATSYEDPSSNGSTQVKNWGVVAHTCNSALECNSVSLAETGRFLEFSVQAVSPKGQVLGPSERLCLRN